jgi:hypothetical protein
LKEILSKAGLSEVKTIGEDFDPCLHHAVRRRLATVWKRARYLRSSRRVTFLIKINKTCMVVISKGASDDNIPDGTFQGACEENKRVKGIRNKNGKNYRN